MTKRVVLPKQKQTRRSQQVLTYKPRKPKPELDDDDDGYEDWMGMLEAMSRNFDCSLVKLYSSLLLKTLRGEHGRSDQDA